MKKHFSLIEIAISLGVAFLAITVLIAFFPTSFKRIQTSQNRSYATNAIAHFVSHLKNTLIEQPAPDKFYESASTYNSNYQGFLDKWAATIAINDQEDNNPLPTVKISDNRFLNTDLLADSNYKVVSSSDHEGSYIHQHDTVKSVYLIRNFTKISSVNIVDQTIAARVWKTSYTSATLLTNQENLETVYQSDNDYSQSVRVNIEFSWPVSRPPSEREKFYTFFDLSK